MKSRIAFISIVTASLALSGCIFVRDHHHGSHHKSSKSGLSSASRDCDKNQYWDGSKCRHKGKGHGARKHDD